MELTAKLQIKPGTDVSVLGTGPDRPDLSDLGQRTDQLAEAGTGARRTASAPSIR